jgi:fanconi anemia group I protein
LPFIKNVFKINEEYKLLVNSSGWAKSIDSDFVDTDILLKILKQNTCMLKQDIALNGLFGLSFLLLKTKGSSTLNKFAIDFLNEIIKNRPEFTNDIMQVIVKMLFYEENKTPIVECFSTIIQNRSLNINYCESALAKLIEDLTELNVETALAIENVLFTVISKSIKLRDLMIDVMKSAIYQRSENIRKLAIFSFCLMLRKFSKAPAGMSHQHHNLSMFSLTQSQMPISSDSNIRQVEVLMLEILGMLRKAFSETRDLKVMLYQSLLSSVEVNTFIISNIFEFLEGHFRGYLKKIKIVHKKEI